MRVSYLRGFFNAYARVLGFSQEEIDNYVKEYSIIDDEVAIPKLCNIVYEHFGDNEEWYDYFLDLINNINPDISRDVNYMKTVIVGKARSSKESLVESHQELHDILEYFSLVLNENNIDYYLTGSLAGLVRNNVPLFNRYDSFELLVNENDLERVGELFTSNGYEYSDDRFVTYDRYVQSKLTPPHSVVRADNQKNGFHINIKPFRREEDNSITTLEYIHIPEDGNVRVDVIERHSTPLSCGLQYDDSLVEYGEGSFRTVSTEAIYDTLTTKIDKDSIETKPLLEPFVDLDKLKQLRRNVNKKIILKDVKKEEMKL